MTTKERERKKGMCLGAEASDGVNSFGTSQCTSLTKHCHKSLEREPEKQRERESFELQANKLEPPTDQ